MDEAHLGAALRYVALNPVRARLVQRATDWRWSSVHAQLGVDDGFTATRQVQARYPDFAALIAAGEDEEMSRRLRASESIGRPIGDEGFVRELEAASRRSLNRRKPGRKPREKDQDAAPGLLELCALSP